MTPHEQADPTYESLWCVREVATFLGIPNSGVYRARREHGLPSVRIGGTLRFRPASVRAWAAEREAVAEDGQPPEPVEVSVAPIFGTTPDTARAPVRLLD